MTTEAFIPWTRESAARRAPGLYFADRTTPSADAARPVHGVPLFVGFGRARRALRRPGPPVLMLTRRNGFRDSVDPAPGGFLGAAVAGFFANGGELCAVLPVEPGDGPASLVRAFAAGGVLEDVSGIDLVCVPDAAMPFGGGAHDASALQEIQAAVVEHCEAMGDRFAILDAVPGAADAVIEQSHRLKTRFAALYFPWLRGAEAPEEAGAARGRCVPPCGHVAGVYARSDARVGVHKAPANERLEGAMALEHELDAARHGALNDAGINCIRGSAASGIRVWGARTLSGQPDWLYVPVSRLFVALAAWLKHRLDDLVFEPHTPELRLRLQRRLSGYCIGLMDAGALAGTDPERAFFVRCDSENNPPGSLEAGRLVADVGLAPTVPAEFVVVRITHDANGIAVTGL